MHTPMQTNSPANVKHPQKARPRLSPSTIDTAFILLPSDPSATLYSSGSHGGEEMDKRAAGSPLAGTALFWTRQTKKIQSFFSGRSTSREVTLSSWKMYSAVTSLVPRSGWRLKKKKKERKKKKRKRKKNTTNNKQQQQNERTPSISTPQHPQILTARARKYLLLVAVQDCVRRWKQPVPAKLINLWFSEGWWDLFLFIWAGDWWLTIHKFVVGNRQQNKFAWFTWLTKRGIRSPE